MVVAMEDISINIITNFNNKEVQWRITIEVKKFLKNNHQGIGTKPQKSTSKTVIHPQLKEELTRLWELKGSCEVGL